MLTATIFCPIAGGLRHDEPHVSPYYICAMKSWNMQRVLLYLVFVGMFLIIFDSYELFNHILQYCHWHKFETTICWSENQMTTITNLISCNYTWNINTVQQFYLRLLYLWHWIFHVIATSRCDKVRLMWSFLFCNKELYICKPSL